MNWTTTEQRAHKKDKLSKWVNLTAWQHQERVATDQGRKHILERRAYLMDVGKYGSNGNKLVRQTERKEQKWIYFLLSRSVSKKQPVVWKNVKGDDGDRVF